MKSEIGQLIYQLSKGHAFPDLLKKKLKKLLSVEHPCEVQLNPCMYEPVPIPYEIEFNLL